MKCDVHGVEGCDSKGCAIWKGCTCGDDSHHGSREHHEAVIKTGSHGIAIKDDDANVDFGTGDFTIIGTTQWKSKFYINKTFQCPVCGWEAEHSTNLEGEPENKPFCRECFKKAGIPIMELKND